MNVSVDIRQQDGKRLADTPRTTPPQATEVFDAPLRAADDQVRSIIAANLGRKAAPH